MDPIRSFRDASTTTLNLFQSFRDASTNVQVFESFRDAHTTMYNTFESYRDTNNDLLTESFLEFFGV